MAVTSTRTLMLMVFSVLLTTTATAALVPLSASAQIDDDTEEEGASYVLSYHIPEPDAINPVTVGSEYHLYNPGDEVTVRGSVWVDLVEQIDELDLIRVEIKDGDGNVVAQEDAPLQGDGQYEATLRLVDNIEPGTYTVESRVQLEVDALGIVEAITSAALNSSIDFVIATPATYNVEAENQNFEVIIASNSNVDNFEFSQEEKKILFFAEGTDGTVGVTEITIPKVLLSGDMKVFINQNLAQEDQVLLKSDTETDSTFEINYTHSVNRVEVTGTNVIPEFSLAVVAMAAAVSSIIAIMTLGRVKGFSGLAGYKM